MRELERNVNGTVGFEFYQVGLSNLRGRPTLFATASSNNTVTSGPGPT